MTRLLGVDGANELEAPLPNVLVDHVLDGGGLGRGVAYWLGNAMLQTGLTPQQIAEGVDGRELDLFGLERAEEGAVRERVTAECAARLGEISARFDERRAMRERLGDPFSHPARPCATCSRQRATCMRTWCTRRRSRRRAATSWR